MTQFALPPTAIDDMSWALDYWAAQKGDQALPPKQVIDVTDFPKRLLPMLFLSGTRDALAERALLTEVAARLGARARLHWLDDADHGYRVRKRERRDPRSVFDEIADETEAFVRSGGSGRVGT